ncbi:SDR family NAD(P)-dependent oxidoreductase [Nocardia nova]|uniref:SDR family NAD(P)-dependent oxidoreductase n=1 Tax=Nocardia nova TaxID=37330 RepID=UPI0033F6AB91
MSRREIAGLVVAITGGAGGLGTALARKLADRGAKVALLDRDAHVAEKAAIGIDGPELVRGWDIDVRDSESLEHAFHAVADHFGRIDVIVANAAVMMFTSVADQDPEAFAATIDVNLTGVWRTFRAGIPHVEQTGGYLLAISSMSAFGHQPLQGVYSASKAGVWALANVARLELAPRGIGVGTLFPTFFDSPMVAEASAHPAAAKIWSARQKWLGMLPTTTLDFAAGRAVKAISRRARTLTVRPDHWVVSRMPGLFQPYLDGLGWSPDAIREATILVNSQAKR